MFEKKHGQCFFCNNAAVHTSNWKNDWFICDDCLGKVLPYLRRLQPEGLLIKSKGKLEVTTLWKPFKKMDLATIKSALEFSIKNEELAEQFEPDTEYCEGYLQVDTSHGLFQTASIAGTISPVVAIDDVKEFYVLDHYQQYDPDLHPMDLAFNAIAVGSPTNPRSRTRNLYGFSEICIETNLEHVPFMLCAFPILEENANILMHSKKKMRAAADEELSALFGMASTDTRKLIHSEVEGWDLMEFNPATKY